jgi:integrase
VPRNFGSVYRRSYKDRKGRARLTTTYWADYSVGGKRQRESTGTTTEKAAIEFLHRRLAEGGHAIQRREAERTSFADLEEIIRADYRKRQRRSMRRLETALTHLRAAFGGWKAHYITPSAWSSYQDTRLRDDASHASINRERSALVRMFRLAAKYGLVLDVPDLDSLPEDNVRDVDVSPAELARLLGHLPAHLQPLVTVGAITGWRRGELLSRTWADVDQEAGFLWLDRETSKNKEPRAFPLGCIGWLDQTLADQYQQRRRIERATEQVVPWLFFYLDGLRQGRSPRSAFPRSQAQRRGADVGSWDTGAALHGAARPPDGIHLPQILHQRPGRATRAGE